MRILLVEGDQRLSAVIERGLVADRYAVDTAGDGYGGLEYFETYSYDLILLDIAVPRLSGTVLLERIRSSNPAVPVLVLSSSESIDEKVRLFNIGADDHLTKPVFFAELRARIQALLRRRIRSLSPNTVCIAGLELDRLAYQVRFRGKSTGLTSQEFLLLDYLMRHPKNVHSRYKLAQNAWNRRLDEKSNTVEVCIQKLRKKIGGTHKDGPIRTIPGVGYTISGRGTWEAF